MFPSRTPATPLQVSKKILSEEGISLKTGPSLRLEPTFTPAIRVRPETEPLGSNPTASVQYDEYIEVVRGAIVSPFFAGGLDSSVTSPVHGI
jgi:hypothetical protein